MFSTWYEAVATVLGIGRIGRMPGTLGTLAAAAVSFIVGGIHWAAVVAVIIVGTAAADRYAKAAGREDPSEVVIDEVAGYWTAMLGLDASYGVVAFFLFRVVDIFKPFPVNKMERLPGGIGIMADDICGGAIVNVLLRALHWTFFEGGLEVIKGAVGYGG